MNAKNTNKYLYFLPSQLQLLYSLVMATLIALYWCRYQLSEHLVRTGSQTSVDNFHEILTGTLSQLTGNDIAATLSVAVVWAVVGLVFLAIIYESINMFILLRNDIMIASKFTHAEENKRQFLVEVLVRALLGVGFAIFITFAFFVLAPFWHELISQPVDQFFNLANLAKEIAGVLGLAATIAFAWRWVLVLLPKFV